MNDKSVAIVISTFNRAHFLEKAIFSALNQTYPCQVIVCDHGSTDETPEMMGKYKGQLIYIRRERDFGPFFSWLEGILYADAEYIHLLHDDDWIDKHILKKLSVLWQKK